MLFITAGRMPALPGTALRARDVLMMFESRSYELEHLDKGDYTAEEYESCIVELQLINRWLGDARALKRSLLSLIDEEGLKTFSVLDVGAGSGELLRVIARNAVQKKQ